MGCGQSKIHLYPRKSKSKTNGKKGGHNAESTDADDDEGHQEDHHLNHNNEKKDFNKNDEKNYDDSNTSFIHLHHQNSTLLNNHEGKGGLDLQDGQQNGNGEIPLPLWWPQLEHRNKGLSSSQQDFFRMLDQKIEDGPDYDSCSEKEMALEDMRVSGLMERWESASITASLCSSTSRSLQNTPVRQQQQQQQLQQSLALRQQIRVNVQPQPLSAELLKQQQQQHPLQQQPQNSSPKRDNRSIISQTIVHQSYGISSPPPNQQPPQQQQVTPLQQQQQQQQQQDRRYWSLPTPVMRMQQPFVGQYPIQPPLVAPQTSQIQLPIPPKLPQPPILPQQLAPLQTTSTIQTGINVVNIEPRFPPTISVQRLAPQVQRQIRETQELIKETCPQRYSAGYGSPGPPIPRAQQRQQNQTQPPPTRRNPLETHYSQELS